MDQGRFTNAILVILYVGITLPGMLFSALSVCEVSLFWKNEKRGRLPLKKAF